MPRTLSFLLAVFFLPSVLYGQVSHTHYCEWAVPNAKLLKGRKVKIYDNGGVYSTLSGTKYLKWPSRKIRKLSCSDAWGNYYPMSGDTGTIVDILFSDQTSDSIIYLLNIHGHYVPIGCGYITEVYMPSDIERTGIWRDEAGKQEDMFQYGCGFRWRYVQDFLNRGAVYLIDTVAEDFACELVMEGIDTVVLCKYFNKYHPTRADKSYVLWVEDGRSFAKAWAVDSQYVPVAYELKSMNAKYAVEDFFILRLDTLRATPLELTSSTGQMNMQIQLYTPGEFYCIEDTQVIDSGNRILCHPIFQLYLRELFGFEGPIKD